MSRKFFISFGVWIMIVPFFGIPDDWKNILIALSGLFLVLVFSNSDFFNKKEINPDIKKEGDLP